MVLSLSVSLQSKRIIPCPLSLSPWVWGDRKNWETADLKLFGKSSVRNKINFNCAAWCNNRLMQLDSEGQTKEQLHTEWYYKIWAHLSSMDVVGIKPRTLKSFANFTNHQINTTAQPDFGAVFCIGSQTTTKPELQPSVPCIAISMI